MADADLWEKNGQRSFSNPADKSLYAVGFQVFATIAWRSGRLGPIVMTKLYLDVLDEPRRKVFERLSVFTRLGGVLAGGTAMALQLNHRRSDDFDIFFPSLITNESRRRLISITEKPINIRLDNSRQLTLSDKNGIKVTLVIHEFPPLYPRD